MNEKEIQKYIPLDKSWIIRMGILDIMNGYDDIKKFLAKQKNPGDDLLALERVYATWHTNKEVDVGESGTLYRILKFRAWKLGLTKKFVIRGTLAKRKISDDPSIINLPQTELLKLDNGTSQWASASVLSGDTERLENPPYKLKLTYEAVDYWNQQRQKKETWEPRYDETILKQAETYLKLKNRENTDFIPQQAEDYCFAFVFGYITKEEGERHWPSLRGHESDRIKEMSEMFDLAKNGQEISSKDHRVVQAIAMWGQINNKSVKILYPESVNKSWPQFWDFLIQQ